MTEHRLSRWTLAAAACTAVLAAAGQACAAQAQRSVFGTLANGKRIDAVELTSASGIRVRIITLGARIQSIYTPNRKGKMGDIVLGFTNPQDYVKYGNYFGASVGRYANRIAYGRFSLDGHVYHLSINDDGNSLHGGKKGFDKRIWTIDSVHSGKSASAVLSYISPNGQEGYPGTLHVTATFTLFNNGQLRIQYRATTNKPTIVNISSHSYFNLSPGDPAHFSVSHDILQINASRYTPMNATEIPTGQIAPVAGTPFDFLKPTRIGLRIHDGWDPQIVYGRGYDMNFVLNGHPGTMRFAARLEDPRSGRDLTIYTTAPGLQFYSGNFLNGTIVGRGGIAYRQGDAAVFEPQDFPDAPNHPNFPSATLNPGQVYHNTIVYRFSVSS